ncbi:MAG TPA: DUF4238 domain-containing protein [Gaiellaceae bacterium]|nr:DUF4238 domain-containing protein [Gaiellaceae bacterium]
MGDFDHVVAAFQASPLFAELMEMAATEDFSRLESAAKRQHFVPQMLLREFCREKDGKDWIFQLDITSGQVLRVSPQRAASRRHLYTVVEEDGSRSNQNEGYLALVESHAATALRRFLSDPLGLTDADRATLAFFVALQTQRTPAAAARINEIANSALQMLAGSMFSDRQAFAERYRELFGTEGTPEEIESFRQETIAAVSGGRVRLVDRGGAAFSVGMQHAAEQSFMLFEFDWTLLRCPGAFVTSDRAFAMHDPTPPYPWSTQGILSSPKAETTIPLSEDACVLLRPLGHGLEVQDISEPDAQIVNLRTYGWADGYIFGSTQQAVVNVRKAAKAQPKHVVKPRAPCQLTILDPDPDDDSFAQTNVRRGWPARLRYEGVMHDYVVIPIDRPHPDLHAKVDAAVERRTRKRFGVGEEAALEARMSVNPIHPLDLG